MSALGGVRLKDPKWFQEEVQDPRELQVLVDGKEPGTFAVGKKGDEYFLIHTLKSGRAAVKNLAGGRRLAKMIKVRECTRPYFEGLKNGQSAAKQNDSTGDGARKRTRSAFHSDSNLSIKTRKLPESAAAAQPIENNKFPDGIIEEFENPDWYHPELATANFREEFSGAPLGTFMITGSKHTGYCLSWLRHSASNHNDEIRTSKLLMDGDQLVVADFLDHPSGSFDELKSVFCLSLPISAWQAKCAERVAERAADYQAMEEDALLPDEILPVVAPYNPVEDVRWFLKEQEFQELSLEALKTLLNAKPGGFIIVGEGDRYCLYVNEPSPLAAKSVSDLPFKQAADGKIVTLKDSIEFPDFPSFIKGYGLDIP